MPYIDLARPCPTCKAEIGRKCVAESGRALKKPHQARRTS